MYLLPLSQICWKNHMLSGLRKSKHRHCRIILSIYSLLFSNALGVHSKVLTAGGYSVRRGRGCPMSDSRFQLAPMAPPQQPRWRRLVENVHKKGQNTAQAARKRAIDSLVNIKVRKEGEGGGAPGARVEVPLQTVEDNTAEKVFPCSLWREPLWSRHPHCSLWRNPCCRRWVRPEGPATFSGAGSYDKKCKPWWAHTGAGLSWWTAACGGLTLEQEKNARRKEQHRWTAINWRQAPFPSTAHTGQGGRGVGNEGVKPTLGKGGCVSQPSQLFLIGSKLN